MTTTSPAPTVFDIKPGDIVALTHHRGGEHIITITDTFEYDGRVTLTDETGFDHLAYPGDAFRFVYRAR